MGLGDIAQLPINIGLGGGLPSAGGMGSALGSAAGLGSLGSSGLLSSFMGAAGPAGLALQAAGMIAAPIMQNAQNKKGERIATGNQQAIETAAMQIQDAVNKGQMRPESAMMALKQLLEQAKNLEGGIGQGNQGTYSQSGGIHAAIIVNNILGNLQTKMTNSADSFMKQPLNAGTPSPTSSGGMNPSPTGGSPSPNPSGGDPSSSSGVLDPAGSNEALQNTYLRTKLRGYLLGDQNGIGSTPIGNALKPTSPFDFIPQATQATNNLPKVIGQNQLDQIGQF